MGPKTVKTGSIAILLGDFILNGAERGQALRMLCTFHQDHRLVTRINQLIVTLIATSIRSKTDPPEQKIRSKGIAHRAHAHAFGFACCVG